MSQPRILIADDHTDIRESLATLLRSELPGASVETARNAEDALALIHDRRSQSEPFDLVITDHQMPRMTGLDLLATLVREGDPARRVLMSASDEMRTIARDHPVIDAFLTKPFELEDLNDVVASALATARVE